MPKHPWSVVLEINLASVPKNFKMELIKYRNSDRIGAAKSEIFRHTEIYPYTEV